MEGILRKDMISNLAQLSGRLTMMRTTVDRALSSLSRPFVAFFPSQEDLAPRPLVNGTLL